MPEQFGELQPHEFTDMLDCHLRCKEDNEDMMAYFVCHIMNLMGKELKQSVTPTEILEPFRKPQEKRDMQAEKEYLEKVFKDTPE